MKDKWIPQPYSFKVSSPLTLDDHSLVQSLIVNQEWEVSKVKSLFLEMEADIILSIPLPRNGGQDVLMWHYTKNGRYTVKSGYWVGMEEKKRQQGMESASVRGGSGSPQKLWMRLWSLNLPNKIKLLLWRACNNFLPCLGELNRRKLCAEGRCGGCGHYAESVIHVLWDCPLAKRVWKATFLSEVCKVWKDGNFLDFFAHVHLVAKDEELEWFRVVCWKLWHWRNERVHGKRNGDTAEVLEACSSWWEVWKRCADNEVAGNSKTPTLVELPPKWLPPKSGWFKLNVDGGLDTKRSRFGTRAVCRDESGVCLGVLAVPGIGNISPYCCEVIALRNGLHFCVQEGIRLIEVESDSLLAIQAALS